MINKKYFLLLFIFCVAVFFAVFKTAIFKPENKPLPTQILTADINQPVSIVPATTEKNYFLTLCDGIICIYSCSDSDKVLTDAITYIDIYSLDASIRKSLESGLTFKTRGDLTVFLENISS